MQGDAPTATVRDTAICLAETTRLVSVTMFPEARIVSDPIGNSLGHQDRANGGISGQVS